MVSREPDSCVALSVTAPQPVQLYFSATEVKNHRTIKANIGMSEARDGFDIQEEPWKAPCLRLEILLTAFIDEIARSTVCDDMLSTEAGRAEYSYSMIMGQHEINNWFVSDAPNDLKRLTS